MENLSIYNASRAVPKEAQKQIGGGRLKGFTDINPMWRIKTLTELFGPCGIGWFTEIVDKDIIAGSGDESIASMTIHLFVKVDGEWSKPIVGIGGSAFTTKESKGVFTSDEAFKMAYTDAISIACKALGFGADIYYAKDRTKYDLAQQAAAQQSTKQEPVEDVLAKQEAAYAAMTLDNIHSREEFEREYKIGRSLGLEKDKRYKEAAMVVAAQYPKVS